MNGHSEWEVAVFYCSQFAAISLSFFLEFLLANLTVWLTSCGTMCDFLYLTLNTAHGRIDHHQRRRRRHRCYCCFDHSLDRHHSFIVCALAHVNVCKTFQIKDKITSHKRKKEIKHILPFYWEHLLGLLWYFCSADRVRVRLCCEAKRNYSMMTIWWRLHDSEYLFIYWNFSSISICSFVFSFVRFVRRICLTITQANAEWETSEKWIKWQWYCMLVTTKKKNRWTNETASIKILSFFSCEIRMRCLCNRFTVARLVRYLPIHNSCKSTEFLRSLSSPPSLSRLSFHFCEKNCFHWNDPDGSFVWVRAIQQKTPWQIYQCARHRRHATPEREKDFVVAFYNELNWNEMKIEKAAYICVCPCEVNAIASVHGYIRLWRWWKVIDLHQPTNSGSDSSSRCSRHRRRRKLFIFWQRAQCRGLKYNGNIILSPSLRVSYWGYFSSPLPLRIITFTRVLRLIHINWFSVSVSVRQNSTKLTQYTECVPLNVKHITSNIDDIVCKVRRGPVTQLNILNSVAASKLHSQPHSVSRSWANIE